MDSDDDWENDLEDQVQGKAKDDDAKNAKDHEDEDKVDTEALKKKEKEEAAAKARQAQEHGRQKNQSSKIDLDKQFEKRQGKFKDVDTSKIDMTGKSKTAQGIAIETAQEAKLADDLFGDDDDEPTQASGVLKPVKLNDEKDYKEFGKNTAEILYKGSAPYRIESFFKELTIELPNHLDSKQMKKIVDHLTSKYNEKVRSEKEKAKSKEKPKIKAGKANDDYARNNNAAMIAANMGLDGGDDDYGDYGDEQNFKREGEAEVDFM